MVAPRSSLTPKPSLQAHIAASPLHRDLVAFLKDELEKERQLYENSTASEFIRGRVIMLRDVLGFVEGSKRK